MNITHESDAYRKIRSKYQTPPRNGAYFYSVEIVNNIIPRVYTNRPWVTIRTNTCVDHAIVFIHNNLSTDVYDYLKDYKDLILVCGIPETCEKMAKYGKTIYLPLSVDVDYIKQFKQQTHPLESAFAGRFEKSTYGKLPRGIDYICNCNRPQMLRRMALYKNIYAVGRCALEAKVLGCNVLPYDKRFPDPDIWQVLDNKDAAKILQDKLNEIEKEIKNVHEKILD